jgi:hypothetical protein
MTVTPGSISLLISAAFVLGACGVESPEPKPCQSHLATSTTLDAGVTDVAGIASALDGGQGVLSASTDSSQSAADASGAGPTDSSQTGTAACPTGVICVDTFPFSHQANTSSEGEAVWSQYNCKPSADESGNELIYRVQVKKAGLLSAAVYDGVDVDVDVHILGALDPNACLARGDRHARADVEPGTWYVVVDTFAKSGKPYAGKYKVDIGLYIPSEGACAMEAGLMKRVKDGGKHLQMPATGPIVMEAHLVTQEEPPPYPTTSTDELAAHYALSQAKTGLVMYRNQKWAPLEGGSFYGAGINSPKLFPVLDEGWYVNMYWSKESRPKRGTRMILRAPGSNRAVVVAAGYETGPGNLANIGGAPEEPHFYLSTVHKSVLQLGIAKDQSLPFGPRMCTQ